MKLPTLPVAFRKKPAPKTRASVAALVRHSAPASVLPLALPGNLLARLEALKRRYKIIGVSQGLAILVSAMVLLLLAQTLCDWWFDLPTFARAGFLVGDVVLLGILYVRHLHPALRHRLTVAEAALLVERKWPQLRQSVIAAVQLAEGRGYSTRGSAQLVSVVLEQARARTMSLNFKDVVPVRLLRRALLVCGLLLLIGIAATVLAWPASRALLERIVLINVPLPTKTIVIPITRDFSVPIGSDVVLSAKAAGVIPSHGRVTLLYAHQPSQDYPIDPVPGHPETFNFTLRNVQSPFRYTFVLNDGHGPDFNVTTLPPPSIVSIECEQTLPAYTGLPPRALSSSDLSLLAGSRLHIKAVSTHFLSAAKVLLQGTAQTIDATVSSDGTHLEADIPIPAKDLTGFSLHLMEPSGITSVNETVYPINLVQDAPPVLTLLEPSDDRVTITLRAKVRFSFEASDDFALTRLAIRYQIIPPPVAGQEDSPAAKEAQSISIPLKSPDQGTHYDYQLDVASQSPGWKEGDTIKYWVEAIDNNTVTGPGITRTDPRQFTVISVAAKQTEISDRLRQRATEINEIYNSQQSLNGEVRETIPQH